MSSDFELPAGKPISLEVLIALNQEIVSLCRAGVPLELGLQEVALDQPGRLGALTRDLGERMSRGQSLSEALAAEGENVPKAYRTVVEAGLRAGRLPAALEALTAFASSLLDLRRKLGFALLYPAIVLSMAYVLFLVLLLEVAGRIRDTYELIGLPIPPSLWLLGRAGETTVYWGWAPPLMLALFILLWFRSGGAKCLNPAGPGFPLNCITGLKQIVASHQAANFAQLLAMMLEHQVPLSEGIVLSAEATTSPAFAASAREAAETIARGEQLAQMAIKPSGMPPFLRWLMAGRERQESLLDGMRLAAEMYRRRANDQTAWLRLVFPVVAAVVIGGGATLMYTLTLFLPLANMLRDMAGETAPY